jgi:hypothetical protein
MKREITNAKIESTFLGCEDHGIPTAYVGLAYDGGGQSFGGYRIDGTAMSLFVLGVLNAVGAPSWEALPGVHVRVDADMSRVYRIGHIMKDQWYDVEASMATCRA